MWVPDGVGVLTEKIASAPDVGVDNTCASFSGSHSLRKTVMFRCRVIKLGREPIGYKEAVKDHTQCHKLKPPKLENIVMPTKGVHPYTAVRWHKA
jgi:hypothetical protein